MFYAAALRGELGEINRDPAHLGNGRLHRRQWRVAARSEREPVEAHDGDIVRNGQPARTERADESERDHVVCRDDRGWPLRHPDELLRGAFARIQPDAAAQLDRSQTVSFGHGLVRPSAVGGSVRAEMPDR